MSISRPRASCENCKHWSSPRVIEGSRNIVGLCSVPGGPRRGQSKLGNRTYPSGSCDKFEVAEDQLVRLDRWKQEIREQSAALNKRWGSKRSGPGTEGFES